MTATKIALVAWAIIALAIIASAEKPKVVRPAGTVVATATLGPVPNTTSTGKGNALLVIPPVNQGNASISVNLMGSLTNVIMAHIHLRNVSARNPILVGVWPSLNGVTPVLLNPPITYKGSLKFNTSFNVDVLAASVPGLTRARFVSLLESGLLYVNVHTVAQPAGAIQGTLACRGNCGAK